MGFDPTRAAGGFVGVSAGGTSNPFSLPTGATGAYVASIVAGIAGNSPSFQLFLDLADAAGNFQQVAAVAAQTATGTQTSLVQPLASNLTTVARFRWTISAASGSPTANVGMFCTGA